VGLLGWWVRRRQHVGRLCVASLIGSSIFFVVSNFGVWFMGHPGSIYPKTAEGLGLCYVAAIPFFRNALIGDVLYTAALFGLYALASRALPRVTPAH